MFQHDRQTIGRIGQNLKNPIIQELKSTVQLKYHTGYATYLFFPPVSPPSSR